MNNRPLPETIRGSWYLIAKKSKTRKHVEKSVQVVRFRLDGSFSHFKINEEGNWIENEKGDYTFDGSFLITRGGATETYRVKRFSHWKWELEGNKCFYDLIRGNPKKEDLEPLSEEDLKEIRILPIRVVIESSFQNDADSIYDLFYIHNGKRIQIGSFFTTVEGENRYSVGLSPFVDDIAPQTWERIIRESYLDMYKGKPENIGVVTIRFLNAPDSNSRIFNYS